MKTDLIYGVEDRPPFKDALFAALQHLLAIFVAIITPPLIIASALKLDVEKTSFLVSMSLFASGVSTFIQCRRFGAIGAKLLCIQGTSFSFIGPIIATGLVGGLPLIFGSCMAAAPIEMIVSRTFKYLRNIITPLVSGIVVLLIGLSLIKVGIVSCGGGYAAMDNGTFATWENLSIAGLVLLSVLFFNRCRNKYLRMSFFTDPIENSGFPEQWTLFFQAFCLTYTGLMGIFIAKVSKGRTIKEVSLCCLLGISISVWVLFAIDGGYSIYAQTQGIVSVTDILSKGGGQDLVYGVIETLPGGKKGLPFVMLVMIAGFVASSLDSASFSLAQTVTSKLDRSGNVSTGLRIACCLVLTMVPLSVMFVKADFSALKSLAILVSIPFMFVMIFMEIVLFKWLREDGKK